MENLVGSLGFVAHTFESAEGFLASPQLETTSCLISDVQMPGVSGTELHEILRRRGYSYPIILITAYPNSSELLRATEAGQTFILQKPLDNRALIGNLKDALRRHFG